MAKHRRVASSSPEPEEQTPVTKPTVAGRGAPRKAKEKAEEAWHPLVPVPRKAKVDKKQSKSASTQDKKHRTSSSSGRARELNAERYAAPEIDINASDDDAVGGASVSKKAPAGKPESLVPGKSSTRNNQEAGSESESELDGDEDADEREADNDSEDAEDSSEESGLEKLEDKPGALQALFDKEEVTWVDEEESRERDNDSASRHSVTASAKPCKSTSSRSTSTSPHPPTFDLDDTRPPPHISGTVQSAASGVNKKKRQKKHSTSDSSDEDTPQPLFKKVKAIDSTLGSGKRAPKDVSSSKPARKAPSAKDQKTASKGTDKSRPGEVKGNKQKGVGKGDATTTGKRKRAKADETIVWKAASDSEQSEAERPPKKKPHTKSKLDSDGSSSESSESSGSSDSDSDSDSDHDDDGIDLVLPRRSGKRMKLKKQRPRVKEVAKLSITYILRDICIVNAFPDGPEKSSDFARRALRQAAKDRGELEMARRLKVDKPYWKKLTSIPTQRIPNFRGRVKKATDSVPGNVFNVHQGDVEHVQWLQEGLRYMYPHDYPSKTITSTAPYESPVFANILRTVFFAKPRSYGYTLVKDFESSDLEHPDQKEIPAAMLALVSTAIYASLEDYRKSLYNVGDFKADLFLDAYKQNISELTNLKNAKPRKYHNLMHGLYLKACSGSSVVSHKPAVSFLNLKDMPDE